jgi:cyclopropane fatty-acyl-phospholipid synthase-like methyltransferase
MENLNGYLEKYKQQFESEHHLMTVNNHYVHNPDPEYWNILLGDVKNNPELWEGKNAFDFGCGCGRNLENLSTLANWANIDGCDISPSNAKYAKEWFDKKNTSSAVCTTWENNGKDIQPTPLKYDFIMSHIVFQHISNYDVRFSIITDMYNSLNDDGLCSLHFMDLSISSTYYENSLEYKNCRVLNEQYLVDDFKKIGFNNVTVETGNDYLTSVRSYYIKGNK